MQRTRIFHGFEPQAGVAIATGGPWRADERFDDEPATGPIAITDEAPTADVRIGTTLTFRPTPRRWYRSRRVAIALAAATAVAATAVVVLTVWRGSLRVRRGVTDRGADSPRTVPRSAPSPRQGPVHRALCPAASAKPRPLRAPDRTGGYRVGPLSPATPRRTMPTDRRSRSVSPARPSPGHPSVSPPRHDRRRARIPRHPGTVASAGDPSDGARLATTITDRRADPGMSYRHIHPDDSRSSSLSRDHCAADSSPPMCRQDKRWLPIR
ncbi:hypothetical protein ACVWWN_004667 [Mycobacterium sp. URHB0021]